RDHGLPSYAEARVVLGLPPRTSFAAIGRDAATAQGLASVYGTVDKVDLWIGALAEAPEDGAMVGETLRTLLADQFRRLRDGDRFWYEARFDPDEVADLAATRLADVIRRNTDIGNEIDRDVFRVGAQGRRP
ncbi:MAG: peroxidase, partial [Planctomycetes bacterium]|nr:peroxidase [Planctomycetota bacterium]